MSERGINRLLVHTIKKQSTHFGTRALYYSFVCVEWKDGSEARTCYPIDVPSGEPAEAESSHSCHERVVHLAITGELFKRPSI
jgi:hypothetical protein